MKLSPCMFLATAHLRAPKERALIAKVERDVVKDDKLIELTIPEKPRSRLQRYRVTRKGRQVAKLLAQSNRAAATLKEE